MGFFSKLKDKIFGKSNAKNEKYVAAMEHPSIEDVRYLRAAVTAYEVISASVWDEAPFRRVMK